jgi:hypothetical protein
MLDCHVINAWGRLSIDLAQVVEIIVVKLAQFIVVFGLLGVGVGVGIGVGVGVGAFVSKLVGSRASVAGPSKQYISVKLELIFDVRIVFIILEIALA